MLNTLSHLELKKANKEIGHREGREAICTTCLLGGSYQPSFRGRQETGTVSVVWRGASLNEFLTRRRNSGHPLLPRPSNALKHAQDSPCSTPKPLAKSAVRGSTLP